VKYIEKVCSLKDKKGLTPPILFTKLRYRWFLFNLNNVKIQHFHHCINNFVSFYASAHQEKDCKKQFSCLFRQNFPASCKLRKKKL
jgi:hypothetical protein